MISSRPQILVIRGGAIGDFILTLPAIAALRAQFPHAHLELLGYPHIAQLATAAELVDRVQPIEARSLAGFFARHGDLAEDWRDYFSEFDLIVSYLYDPDEIFRANVQRCSPAQFIQGPHRPDPSVTVHATQVYLKPLEQLAIFDADPVPRLPMARPAQTNDVLLALHPGSGSERKNWPETNWAAVLAWVIQNTSLQVLLVGGEAEGDRLDRLAAALPPARLRVARSLPLAKLAVRLQHCRGFVGHDSGITHLAAALGLPCLVLWADTPQHIWQPLGQRIKILRDPTGIRGLAVNRVVRELDWLLGDPETKRSPES